MSVGVMEDYKLRDLRASHTLGLAFKLSITKFLTAEWQTRRTPEITSSRWYD
jgi:hypothetical protein